MGKTQSPSDDFWIKQYECIANSYYNVYCLNNQKTMKPRFGGVYRNGKPLFGVDVDVSVRRYDYKHSHCWVETNDGKVIDWVLNEVFGTVDVKVWDMQFLKEQGIEYRYFTNEKGIEKKANKTWKSISEIDRQLKGDMASIRGIFNE
jgi:hypothetical protein